MNFKKRCLYWHCPRAEHDLCICRASVRLSVCIYVLAWTTAAEFAAVARPAEDIDRLLHGAKQRGVRCGGECGECHVVSVSSS